MKSVGVLLAAASFASAQQTIPVGMAWDPVTLRADGSPIGALAGYRIYYASASFKRDGNFLSPAQVQSDPAVQAVDVPATATSHTLNLAAGQVHYIRLTAVEASESESAFNLDAGGLDVELVKDLSMAAAPSHSIAELVPASGPPGTRITIRGEGFSPSGNAVLFGPGSVAAADLESMDGRTLTFQLPKELAPLCVLDELPCESAPAAAPPGAYGVTVVNGGRTSNALSFERTEESRTISVSPDSLEIHEFNLGNALLRIEILPGTFDGPASIQVGINADPPAVSASGGNMRAAGVAFDIDSPQPKRPVKLRLSRLAGLTLSAEPSAMTLARYNETGGRWFPLNGRALGTDAYSAETDHFSTFQLMGLAPGPVPELHEAFVYPNPAVGSQAPVVRAFLDQVERVEISIFDISGDHVHSGSLTGTPTGVRDGRLYYDYPWAGRIASGVYFAVIHGIRRDTILRARAKFAVIR